MASQNVDLDYLKRKYKNVHEVDPRDYTFREIGSYYTPKIASTFCSASQKYVMFHMTGGGGKNVIARSDKPGRYANCQWLPSANSCNYSEFSPHNDNMVALACKGAKFQVFQIPDEAFDDDGKLTTRFDPLVEIEPNTKKELVMVRWHPTVANLILVIGKEKNGPNIWVYDITSSECIKEYETGFEVFSAQWNADGSKIMYVNRSTSADMYVVDPRTDDEPKKIPTGLRDPYLFYCATSLYGAKLDYIGVSGTDNKNRKVFIKLWRADSLELEREIKVDGSESTLVPYFDAGRGMLWSYGKTESRIYIHRFFVLDGEINWKKSPKSPLVTTLKKGVTGGCFMGQRGLDFNNIEIQRFFALSNEDKSCYVYKWVTPRSRKGYFNEEFYPEWFATVPSNTVDEWKAGTDKNPTMWSLDPSIQRDDTGAAVFVKKKTYAELDAQVKTLGELLAAARDMIPDGDEKTSWEEAVTAAME